MPFPGVGFVSSANFDKKIRSLPFTFQESTVAPCVLILQLETEVSEISSIISGIVRWGVSVEKRVGIEKKKKKAVKRRRQIWFFCKFDLRL